MKFKIREAFPAAWTTWRFQRRSLVGYLDTDRSQYFLNRRQANGSSEYQGHVSWRCAQSGTYSGWNALPESQPTLPWCPKSSCRIRSSSGVLIGRYTRQSSAKSQVVLESGDILMDIILCEAGINADPKLCLEEHHSAQEPSQKIFHLQPLVEISRWGMFWSSFWCYYEFHSTRASMKKKTFTGHDVEGLGKNQVWPCQLNVLCQGEMLNHGWSK